MKRKVNYNLIYLFSIVPWLLFSQDDYKEQPDDSYIYVDKSQMQKSVSYRTVNSDYFTIQVNVDSNGNDIIGDAANEPSIAIDPTNPDRIVIGWRQFDTVSSNFRQAGFGYSNDGGLTWPFSGVLDPGVYHTDPVLDFDSSGNFYYNSLLSSYECVVYSITDGGVTWRSPVSAKGGDKQWMTIDRTNGIGAGNNYSFWDKNYSSCTTNDFTRSTDNCISFENCEPITGSPKWGTMAVDADGVLYIAGTSSLGPIVVKSTTAQDTSIPVSFDSYTVVNLDGNLKGAGSLVNPAGLLGQMWVATDISGSAGHGNVYVLASVVRNSNTDPGDVMFAKSTDGGQTFNPPTRINTDITGTNNYQWFGTMSVAPNGRIDVIWLDTRDAPVGTNKSVLYYSYSENQGDTWSSNNAISIAFDPNIGYPQQDKLGDYFDMVSDDDGVHLAWANTINGGQDIYYTHITSAVLSNNDVANNMLKVINYPNPFDDKTTIEFSLDVKEHIVIEIFDLLGRKINTLLNREVIGKQKITWKGDNQKGNKLKSGIYLIVIQSEREITVLKAIIK